MANKYFIFGATYNGDGTSSAEAGSNGGVGAWSQDTILTGTAPTYGTLAAGDTVYIRSKTGNGANANISKTLAASITLGAGNGVATLASPITWILDDGTVWSGQNGTLTYTSSNASYTVSLRDYNRFLARTKHNWIIECTNATPPGGFFVMNATETRGLMLRELSRGSISGGQYGNCLYDAGYHADLKVYVNKLYNTGNQNRAMLSHDGTIGVGAETIFDNLEVEVTTAGSSGALFMTNGYFTRTLLRGGKLHGDGASNTEISLVTPAASAGNLTSVEAVGFQIPKTCSFGNEAATWYNASHARAYGLDGGTGGEMRISGGRADTRNYSANYPYLNGTLPDSGGSPCSWRVVPKTAMWHTPMEVSVAKLYTSTAGSKKVTLELLVGDNWGAGVINTQSVWMTVAYVDDATGNMVTESTRGFTPGTALTSSSASWSATSWGSVNFGTSGKRKLELTTANSIKQDTAVVVTFYCTAKCVSETYDIFIVDPDVQLSTP